MGEGTFCAYRCTIDRRNLGRVSLGDVMKGRPEIWQRGQDWMQIYDYQSGNFYLLRRERARVSVYQTGKADGRIYDFI